MNKNYDKVDIEDCIIHSIDETMICQKVSSSTVQLIMNKLTSGMTHRLSCSKGSRNVFRRRRRGRRGGLRPHGATSLAHEGSRRSLASASLPPSKTPSTGRNRPSNILCDIVPVERWPLKNFDLQRTREGH